MTDSIALVGNSVVQHGPDSRRVYLMSLDTGDLPEILGTLEFMAERNDYTKIFAKVPAAQEALFIEDGYITEARIPGFYPDGDDCCFMGRYFSDKRQEYSRDDELEAIRKLALTKGREAVNSSEGPLDGCVIKACKPNQAEEMSDLYQTVFITYPFPIHKPEYIRSTMRGHAEYFGVWQRDRLVALSTAEKDKRSKTIEMTDFATIPVMRKKGLGRALLAYMEQAIAPEEYPVFYTIARARSKGMNIIFALQDYTYAGCLCNNTQIAGRIESMNVWYKKSAVPGGPT